jgi:hypothetical protein
LNYVYSKSPYALPELVTGSDVAANTEFSQTVTAGDVWHLIAVTVVLVQGATDTPLPSLVIDDGSTVISLMPGSTTAQAVNTTCRYTWGPGLVTSGQIGATTNVRSIGGLPAGLILQAGWRIGSSTAGIGANSNYGAPIFTVVKADL